MWNRLKSGMSLAWNQPFAVFALFVYQLIWSIVIYKLIQSVVLPLLHRYPSELSGTAVKLFWIEGQFQLMKTDVLEPLAGWAIALLALRLVLHPVLNAAVYYSMHRGDLNAGYRFVAGIRKLTLPYFFYYIVQLTATLLPLVWLLPLAAREFDTHSSYTSLGVALLPYVAGYMLYALLIKLMTMYLQIGKASDRSVLYSIVFCIRYLPVIAITALAVLTLALLVTATAMTSAFIWAGFIALLGIQAFRLAQAFFEVWAIGVQYALWQEKA
ncbi:hypothetical protein [Paenibacillus sp. YYML68]|uniref:hypothetical protein n=1 Tax=Paenibacillus sp. YYML68 TaxID=2909250 RepID=UPI00248F9775|nr:hypothetical protein [Paenibacillus sp. YYML68]